MSEILITCPLCHQSGFTVRGLRGHWCKSNKGLPLPPRMWKKTVDEALGREKVIRATVRRMQETVSP